MTGAMDELKKRHAHRARPLDERDSNLAELAEFHRRAAEGAIPMQGDLLRYSCGYERRVAHAYTDGVQPASWGGQGSHYIAPGSGHSSYSGALNGIVYNVHLTLAIEVRSAQRFWFFHHDSAGAGRGVDCMIPVRVWDVDAPDTDSKAMTV